MSDSKLIGSAEIHSKLPSLSTEFNQSGKETTDDDQQFHLKNNVSKITMPKRNTRSGSQQIENKKDAADSGHESERSETPSPPM